MQIDYCEKNSLKITILLFLIAVQAFRVVILGFYMICTHKIARSTSEQYTVS